LVAQAIRPLADRNGRPSVTATHNDNELSEDPRDIEIRRLKHTIMQLRKSKHDRDRCPQKEPFRPGNGKRKPYDRNDQENRNSNRTEGTCTATAKIARVEQPQCGYMLTTSEMSSDLDDYSDEEVQTSGETSCWTAYAYCARTITLDEIQSPLGEQTKPMMLDMMADEDEDEPIDDPLQPRAIVVDDYNDTKGKPEEIVWSSPDIIPSRKVFVMQKPSMKRNGKPYSGKEGYTIVPDDIPALVEDDNDVIDNSAWSYGGPQKRELKTTKYPFTIKDESTVIIAYGEHHLVVEDRMYPINSLMREPTQFPPQRVMEEWAMNCSGLTRQNAGNDIATIHWRNGYGSKSLCDR